MGDEFYTGPVCYVDGWHYTVIPHPDGIGNGEPGHVYEVPGERLHLEDTEDGSASRYRLATDADTRSWHDRKHQRFASVDLEDGTPALRVTPEQLERIQKMLDSEGDA